MSDGQLLKNFHKKTKQSLFLGKEDIQKKDIHHQLEAQKMHLTLAQENKHWIAITCVHNNTILTSTEIHTTIVQLLKEKGIIK